MDTRMLEVQKKRVGDLFTSARDGDVDGMLVALAAFDEPKAGGAAAAVLACRDGNRRTALHFAANQGHVKCVNALVAASSDKKALVNAADTDGATPLMMAILGNSDGAMDCVNALITAGADVNARRNDQRDTALHIAARNGHADAAGKLVAAGADLSAHSVIGTPLHEAAAEGETAIIELLVAAIHAQHGSHAGSADAKHHVAKLWLGAKGPRGVTPLLLAAASRHGDASAQLTEAGSPLAVVTEGGLTALHLMAESGHAAAVAAAVRRAARAPAAAAAAAAAGGDAARASGDDAAATEDDASHAMSVANSDGLLPIQLAAAGGHSDIVESMWPHSSAHLSGDGSATPSALIEAEQARRAAEAEQARRAAEAAPASASAPSAAAASASSEATDALEAEADDFVRPAGETSTADAAAALERKARGNEAFVAGRAAEAEALYSEAIALDPRSAVMRLNRSAARLKLRQTMGALTDAVIARKLDATLAKACFREGVARMTLGQFEEAAVALFEGTKLDPANKDIERKFKEAVSKGQIAHKRKIAEKQADSRALRRRAELEETRFRASLKQLKAKVAGSRS